jgi:GNAT superfamily N-acetyltransferase
MKKATSNDVHELVAFMAEFYGESAYSLDRWRATDAFAAILGDERLGHIWFIEAESQKVGYVVLTLRYSMEFGGLCAYVEDFYIRPPFRRAGLGTSALEEVREFCLKHDIRAIHAETGRDDPAAHGVYRRIGFVDTKRDMLTLPLSDPTYVI